MRPLAVIAEALAVIADDHDDRAVEQSAPLENLEQMADLRVDERDRSVVRVAVRVAIGSRRLVRRVRVVEVQPRKEARARHDIEPLHRARDDLVGATPAVLPTVRVPTRDHGVVVREARGSTLAKVEDGGRDERARPKARASEQFGEGVAAAPAAEHVGVLVNPVARREAPSEQAGVGRKRQRRHRLGGFEEHPLLAKRSRCGVRPRFDPYAPRRSARKVSSVMTTRFSSLREPVITRTPNAHANPTSRMHADVRRTRFMAKRIVRDGVADVLTNSFRFVELSGARRT